MDYISCFSSIFSLIQADVTNEEFGLWLGIKAAFGFEGEKGGDIHRRSVRMMKGG